MAIISVKHRGSFKNADRFFSSSLRYDYEDVLHRYGQEGVRLLSEATPVRTGETASKWDYEIEHKNGKVILVFTNSNENQGVNIVRLIVYGHGLWNGGYVQGNDFVSPAIQPLLSRLANEVWREVTK